MPSMLHEGLLLLFREEPLLASRLVERALCVPLPAHTAATLEDVTLTQIVPTQFPADAVVVLHDDKPVHAIIVEIQIGRDPDKRYSWPVYATTLRARLRCPATVLVVTPREDIAAWAAQPIDLGVGSTFAALVVGPGAVPRVSDVSEARRNPELAVLSVIAHGHDEDATVLASAALHAAADLDAERSILYHDLILSALAPAARAGLEKMMKTKYEFQSDFAKKYVSMGREEGRKEATRELLGRLLERPGVDVDSATSERLDAASLGTLELIAEEVFRLEDAGAIATTVRRILG